MTIAEALDHLKLNNALVMDLVQCHKHTYEFEIKDTTDTDRSASYLDLHLEIEWGAVKNETLRQKGWFQFSHCELSIHM